MCDAIPHDVEITALSQALDGLALARSFAEELCSDVHHLEHNAACTASALAATLRGVVAAIAVALPPDWVEAANDTSRLRRPAGWLRGQSS